MHVTDDCNIEPIKNVIEQALIIRWMNNWHRVNSSEASEFPLQLPAAPTFAKCRTHKLLYCTVAIFKTSAPSSRIMQQ